MPIDPGAVIVDELIEKLIKKYNAQYYQATKESNQKLKVFLKDYNEKNKEKKKQVKSGTLSKEKYNEWLEGQTHKKQYLQEMINQLSADAAITDMKAMSALKSYMPEAFAVNTNYAIYQIDSQSLMNISWTLYDRNTVERIVAKRPNLLPDPKPDIPKEMRWHKTRINNAITQGILQGESIPKIAKRLQEVTDMDRRAAIRNARTAMTGAQNAGRIEGYKYAQSLGIELEQEWLATLDSRTRDSHRQMDGERVEVGKKFSNGCKFPGDPAGPGEEIYNCRCTLVPALAELDQSDAERFSRLDGEDYEEWKFGKENTELKKTQYELKAAQNKFDQMDDKVYTGIWKDPVNLSDYPSKAASISAKRKYYEDALKNWDVPDSPEYKKHKMLLDQLNEYERLGKKYSDQRNLIMKLSQKANQLGGGQVGPFTPDAYDEMRKTLAQKFAGRNKADKYFRPLLDAQWDDLTREQKYALWEYTHNSNPMNKPLSGYEQGWDRGSFKGVGKADWSSEDSWRWLEGEFTKMGHSDGHVDYAGAIRDLTMGIEKTPFSDDIWLRRGSDSNGFAGLLEGDLFSFNDAKKLINGDVDTLKQALVGQSFQFHSFMSTGIADDAGFHNNIEFKIYCPKGTKAIYAEPQSHFGSTVSSEFYKVGQSYYGVGSEAEVIIQRGTTFRIVDVKKKGYDEIEVTMEVVNQPDYFRTGFEQTFDNGATEYKYRGRH